MQAIDEDLGWWYDVKVMGETETHFTLQWVEYPRWPQIQREKSKCTFSCMTVSDNNGLDLPVGLLLDPL